MNNPKENNSSSKSIIIISLISVLLIGLLVVLATTGSKEVEDEIPKKEDEPIKYAYTENTDSINKVNETIIKDLKPLFKIKKDEYSNDNKEFYIPKSAPKYANENGFYTYFQVNDNKASNFRLKLQYLADEWLFIENVQFSIDGNAYSYTPMNVERDHDVEIWEWFDEGIVYDNDKQLINALATAKTAKMKINGKQYYKEKEITQKQLKSIKNTLELYKAMGGNW